MILTLTLLSTLVAYASAHATFQEFWINGVDQGTNCVRLPASNNPVTDVTSNDLTCNIAAATAPNTCSVMPGDTVSVEMHQQPGDRSCANEAIGGAHYGPINIYMAKVSNAATAVGSSASWFKVNEMGLLSSNPDYWATEVLNDNCGRYDFKIPTGIAPGQYLLRAEVIALHVASSVGGAQFYMSCFQLNVGGSGTANPAAVKIPGAYTANDPGILINIYQQLNTYVIPGPTVYNLPSPAVAATAWPTTATWNTKSMPSTVPPITSAAPTSAPTSAPSGGGGSSTTTASSRGTSTASSPSSTPTQPSGPTSPQYGQCGGIGWTGPTACASPYKCVVTNAYYSQCV